MNNLPLQPLAWEDREDSAMVTTVFRGYWVTSDKESKGKFCVYYGSSSGEPARGFATIEDAKHWAEYEHYAGEMQPYVKPMPTWIDVSERLPESECFYLVRLFDGHRDEHVFVILWWNAEHQQFLEWDAMCEPTHWMPIPEFSTMHKGGDCE